MQTYNVNTKMSGNYYVTRNNRYAVITFIKNISRSNTFKSIFFSLRQGATTYNVNTKMSGNYYVTRNNRKLLRNTKQQQE
ncbi:hypothetical protein T08_6659 [Trichinella sp. T8]|nr:hypothetical protein T08_6659 [Trichinella sp. T8]